MKITDSGFQKNVKVDVNDEISSLIRRIELNFGLSFDEAKRAILLSLKNLKD